MTLPSENEYQTATEALSKLALHDTGTTARRAADLILSLAASEKPQLDLAGLLGYFDDENFATAMTVMKGFRAHGGWPHVSLFGPVDLIKQLRTLHYADA